MQSAGAPLYRTRCVFYCRARPMPTPRRSRSRSPGTTGAEHRPISSHLAHAVERARSAAGRRATRAPGPLKREVRLSVFMTPLSYPTEATAQQRR